MFKEGETLQGKSRKRGAISLSLQPTQLPSNTDISNEFSKIVWAGGRSTDINHC